jgi:hypothetical protein
VLWEQQQRIGLWMGAQSDSWRQVATGAEMLRLQAPGTTSHLAAHLMVLVLYIVLLCPCHPEMGPLAGRIQCNHVVIRVITQGAEWNSC